MLSTALTIEFRLPAALQLLNDLRRQGCPIESSELMHALAILVLGGVRFISSVGRYEVSSKKGQHVVPSPDGWSVRKAGSSRVTRTYSTQHDAIDAATQIARNQRTEVYVHGRDGRIRERNSYGNDSYPPAG